MIFISVQPDEFDFVWQLEIQLNNFRKWGYSEYYHVLVYCPPERGKNVTREMQFLEKCFPEVKFTYFFDMEQECAKQIRNFKYVPLLRPWCLKKYWEQNPHLQYESVFYLDADVIFTDKIDFDKYLHDDICYLSRTGTHDRKSNYISSAYFDNKWENTSKVKPEKIEAFKKFDVLEQLTTYVGISKQTVIDNELNTGGAQYLLKGITPKFWADVFDSCLFIRLTLLRYNEKFYTGANPNEVENNGIQSWCADMWAVLWNLWKNGKTTRTPDEFDFTWSTTPIEEASKYKIHHQAGGITITKDGKTHHLFDKRKEEFVRGVCTPFEDKIYLSVLSNDYCSKLYVDAIKDVIRIINN